MSCKNPGREPISIWWCVLFFVIFLIILILAAFMGSYIAEYRRNRRKRLIIPTEETLVKTNVNEAYEMPVN